MPGIYTVDASVFLNAFNPYETGHAESRRILARMQEQATPMIVPTLLLPEIAAAISRGRADAALAREFANRVGQLPNLMLIPLDATLSRQAVEIAAGYGLRGSDAVYAAVAQRFGSKLLTLDREQHDRVAAVLTTRYPAEALAEA